MPQIAQKPLWLLTLLWSVGMLFASLAALALAAFVLFLLSSLLGTPLIPLGFRFGLLLHLVVWGLGVFAAHRIHRSNALMASLVITGCITFVALPFIAYFLVLSFSGGWKMGH
tara:strand:+ start:2486 stop:2824 length:339 start_codon:yes stop_codon:yes gene_type:complete